MKINQPKEIRPLPKAQGSCNNRKTEAAKGPFGKQVVKQTEEGRPIRMDQPPHPPEDRSSLVAPLPPLVPTKTATDAVVDFLAVKSVNAVNHIRNTWYALKSVVHAFRRGLVSWEIYYFRRTHCNPRCCQYWFRDVETDRFYCGWDPEGCGCPKVIDLAVRLTLVNFRCPAGRFGYGNLCKEYTRVGEPPWQINTGLETMSETKETGKSPPIGIPLGFQEPPTMPISPADHSPLRQDSQEPLPLRPSLQAQTTQET